MIQDITTLGVVAYLASVGVKKSHNHVLRDIRNIVSKLGKEKDDLPKEATYKDSQGKSQPLFILSEVFVWVLLTGYRRQILYKCFPMSGRASEATLTMRMFSVRA